MIWNWMAYRLFDKLEILLATSPSSYQVGTTFSYRYSVILASPEVDEKGR